MSQSDGPWGTLVESQASFGEAWDSYEPLPENGANPVFDAFLASKSITAAGLLRQDARMSSSRVVAFAYSDGIKFRDIASGKRWALTGSTFPNLKIVRGAEPNDTVVVSEGETDGAWLSENYPIDVAILPSGAKHFTEEMAVQLRPYNRVFVALDNDEAGNYGAAKIAEHVGHAVRFAPPGKANDWCEVEAADAPPLPLHEPRGLRTRSVIWEQVRPTRWLWDRRIPLGSLSLLVGEEGIGKGTLVAWFIARVTRGELPGDLQGQPQRVLIVGDEDGFDSVWVPRLHAAGADLDLVLTLEEELDDLTAQHDDLELAIFREDVGLVFFDQLLDHISGGSDGSGVYNPKQVRQALKPAQRIARSLEIPMLATLHPIKGKQSSFRDVVGGSHQFNAVSRSSLLLAVDPEDEGRRVLVRGKGNLSAAPKAFEFRLGSAGFELNDHSFNVPRVTDERESEQTIAHLLDRRSGRGKTSSMLDEIEAVLRGANRALGRQELLAGAGLKDNGTAKDALREGLTAGRLIQDLPRGPFRLPEPVPVDPKASR